MDKFNLKALEPQLKHLKKVGEKHIVFGAIIVILLTYLFMVFETNKLAAVEPSDEAESSAMQKTQIPKVDKKAIKQIQALEKSNTSVHSLFESARKNPFQD
jgi:hypothetical protein